MTHRQDVKTGLKTSDYSITYSSLCFRNRQLTIWRSSYYAVAQNGNLNFEHFENSSPLCFTLAQRKVIKELKPYKLPTLELWNWSGPVAMHLLYCCSVWWRQTSADIICCFDHWVDYRHNANTHARSAGRQAAVFRPRSIPSGTALVRPSSVYLYCDLK